MTNYSRYAIYFSPYPDTFLDKVGSRWLGWNPKKGKITNHSKIKNPKFVDLKSITEKARIYGLHGTLKAPFVLKEKYSYKDLISDVELISKRHRKFIIRNLVLKKLGSFYALVPERSTKALKSLADDCVSSLDKFRKPPSSTELEKRRSNGLDFQEEVNLKKWGYPYVFNKYKFHITLTGEIRLGEEKNIRETIELNFQKVIGYPLPFLDICLFGQRDDRYFCELKRFSLL